MDNRTNYTRTTSIRKNWFIMGLLTLWLTLWGAGLAVVANAILQGQLRQVSFFVIFVLLVWLAGWFLGGGLALYGLLWMTFGKETLAASPGELTLTRSIGGYHRVSHYEATKIRSLRVVEEDQGMTDFLLSFRPFGIGNGMLTFDCGTRVVTFAEGLDRAQASLLLAELRAVLVAKTEEIGV
jgi:hypothetical protein